MRSEKLTFCTKTAAAEAASNVSLFSCNYYCFCVWKTLAARLGQVQFTTSILPAT